MEQIFFEINKKVLLNCRFWSTQWYFERWVAPFTAGCFKWFSSLVLFFFSVTFFLFVCLYAFTLFYIWTWTATTVKQISNVLSVCIMHTLSHCFRQCRLDSVIDSSLRWGSSFDDDVIHMKCTVNWEANLRIQAFYFKIENEGMVKLQRVQVTSAAEQTSCFGHSNIMF